MSELYVKFPVIKGFTGVYNSLGGIQWWSYELVCN